MACIVYCEDKVLVTTEEFPPVVEVDDDYMGQAKSHFHWLLKVNYMKKYKSVKESVLEIVYSNDRLLLLTYKIKTLV